MLTRMLDLLPCRPSELTRFRAAIKTAFAPAEGVASSESALLKETEFMLRSQAHLAELNARYFPQSGMTDKEVVEATAARVGFRMPKESESEKPGDAQ